MVANCWCILVIPVVSASARQRQRYLVVPSTGIHTLEYQVPGTWYCVRSAVLQLSYAHMNSCFCLPEGNTGTVHTYKQFRRDLLGESASFCTFTHHGHRFILQQIISFYLFSFLITCLYIMAIAPPKLFT